MVGQYVACQQVAPFGRDPQHPNLFSSMPPCARHWIALDAASLPRLARKIGQPCCHRELLNQHLRGERSGSGYPWPSEIANWPKPLVDYNVWLSQFAPADDQMPVLEAAICAARLAQSDDLELLERRAHCQWSRRVLGAAGLLSD